MTCLCLKGLHPAPQEHGSALNTDPRGPYLGVCSGSQLHAHIVSHSHLRIFTWRAPQLCAAAPTPLSAVQQYTPSSLSSTLKMVRSCPFLCMLYRVSNSLQGRAQIVRGGETAGTERGDCICICRPLVALQMATCFTFYFQPAKRREGTENAEFGLKIWFGPH